MAAFNALTATRDEIAGRAAPLNGKTLSQLGRANPDVAAVIESAKTVDKGTVGNAIEAWFGIRRNSESLPDFREAGIELKTVPIFKGPRKWRVTERTVIGMIDYMQMPEQQWQTSSARKKLDCLLVFVETFEDRVIGDFLVRKWMFWQPTKEQDHLLRQDWEAIQNKIRAGRAHELTQSEGVMLIACTKGSRTSRPRQQPFSSDLAKPRAFALRAPIMASVWASGGALSIATDYSSTSFEGQVLSRLAPFIGSSLGSVADDLGIAIGRGKSAGADVIREVIGVRRGGLMHGEFRMLGLTPRAPSVNEGLLPYQNISFPAFDHQVLADEEWEDSALFSTISYMLFVPLVAQGRREPVSTWRVGAPVYWHPSAETLDLFRREWTRARDAIRGGGVRSPLRQSETLALHVRPHGRDGTDLTNTPTGVRVVRKSFWMNRRFVQEILTGIR